MYAFGSFESIASGVMALLLEMQLMSLEGSDKCHLGFGEE
jgi:hypothetical protein